ncbi:hypothetical protein ACFXKR_40275 [Streptomyces violascens]|uniref:hypothetical protein n=1 Tax=Streptomyces violascens TaxID=67381 RepID=UPI0036A46367
MSDIEDLDRRLTAIEKKLDALITALSPPTPPRPDVYVDRPAPLPPHRQAELRPLHDGDTQEFTETEVEDIVSGAYSPTGIIPISPEYLTGGR